MSFETRFVTVALSPQQCPPVFRSHGEVWQFQEALHRANQPQGTLRYLHGTSRNGHFETQVAQMLNLCGEEALRFLSGQDADLRLRPSEYDECLVTQLHADRLDRVIAAMDALCGWIRRTPAPLARLMFEYSGWLPDAFPAALDATRPSSQPNSTRFGEDGDSAEYLICTLASVAHLLKQARAEQLVVLHMLDQGAGTVQESAEETAGRDERRCTPAYWVNELGMDIGPAPCSHPGCVRLRVLSVRLCQAHAYAALQGHRDSEADKPVARYADLSEVRVGDAVLVDDSFPACTRGDGIDGSGTPVILLESAVQGKLAIPWAESAVRLQFVRRDSRDHMQEGIDWLKKHSMSKQASAQFTLGRLYFTGTGVSRDPATALLLWRQAAAQGHAEALHALAECHESGNGVPQDPTTARSLHARAAGIDHAAASKGDTAAMLALGRTFRDGRGSPVDAREAMKWFAAAAKRGNPIGTAELAKLRQARLDKARAIQEQPQTLETNAIRALALELAGNPDDWLDMQAVADRRYGAISGSA